MERETEIRDQTSEISGQYEEEAEGGDQRA